MFLFCNPDPGIGEQISQLFPYKMTELDDGLKYLGYYLKPNCYMKEDWNWLIKKVENRISNWTFIYMSIGGRLIFAKSVLESIHVYWLSLLIIPFCMMNNIRKRMPHFLWAGNLSARNFNILGKYFST